MKRSKSGRGILLLVMILVLGLGPGSAAAKSLYVLSSHHAKKFEAWNIASGGNVTWQGTYNIQHAAAPAGVAIHEPSKTLFISSESPNLEVVDATTFASLGQLSGQQFAGLAVDDKNDTLYAMRRGSTSLYAYAFSRTGSSWTLSLKPGFPKTLNLGNYSGMGIALDELSDPAILWVADGANMMIRAYNTSSWSEDTTLSFSTSTTNRGAVGMGIDRRGGIIYWGSMNYGAGVPSNSGSRDLYKFDLATRTLTQQTVTASDPWYGYGQVVDVSVDEDTGLVYLTETSCMSSWDTSTSPWTMIERHYFYNTSAPLSRPATCGIAVTNVSFMPDLAVAKTDDVPDNACVGIGDSIQYTVNYTNTGDTDLTGVTLVDDLPWEVDYVAGGGTYNSSTHKVTWDIGTVVVGGTGSVDLDVQVNSSVTPGAVIINYATIDSNETNQTTVQEKTTICTNQPPSADAGPDQTVEQSSSAGTPVILDGSGSSDPDGDPLTFTWTGSFGTAIGISPTVTLPLGSHLISLTVSDGQATDSDTVMITVVDTTPPDLTVPADVTVEQESAAGTVVPLSATATDICDADVDITDNQMAIYPLGVTVVTFTATDDSGNVSSKTVTVTVVDTTPPVLTVNPSMAELWPPNHKYVDITLGVTVTDVCDADVADKVQLVSVTSDEPEDVMGANNKKDGGDGNTVNDIVIVDQNTLQLRAERLGGSDGRVYTINFMVTDASGNTTTAAATVSVRHNPEIPAVDSGVSYTVTP